MSLTPLVIPTFPDEPNYTQRTQLDGVVYRFTFRLNARENTYRIDVALDDGTPIESGVKLVCSIPLLYRYAWDPNAPKGVLVVVYSGGDSSPPGLGDLGDGRRCQLTYIAAADILELQASQRIIAFLKENGGSYASPSGGTHAQASVVGIIQSALSLTSDPTNAAIAELAANGTIRVISSTAGTPIQLILLTDGA